MITIEPEHEGTQRRPSDHDSHRRGPDISSREVGAMATVLLGREFDVFCEDSDLVLSRLNHQGNRPPTRRERRAATGVDVATVIHSLRTISGEILIDKLVETLMVTAVQQAGVERGLLIVRRAEEARVEAEAAAQRGAIVARRLDTLPDPSSLPETILKYVLRTQEPVMLDDACAPNPFSADAYLAEHRIRSLLCLPLVREGALMGALYFEDPLASHIFTPSRIGLLTLLASQAAISLENAHRYAQIQSENIHLREKLHKPVASTYDLAADEELQRTIDAIPHAITILGPDGRTLRANTFVLDFTGLSLEEIRADDSRVRRFHPDDAARIREARLGAFERGEPFEAELRARRKDGQYLWFLIRYIPVRDHDGHIIRWYATGTDIDDLKRAEDRVRGENLALREEVDRSSMFEEIVGTSPRLRAVLSQVSKVAPTDSTVLITGETGTGKELIARAIHKRSHRSAGPFVAVNCAAIPSSLIASELFGHEKGAFTGALQRRQGRFELADGGTIFLDEVGELPAETQIMLLRVLQEREFERVGGSSAIRVNVRVLAATNRDLQAAVADGTFRADLFYRLNVFPLDVPALRERRADIPLLVEYFIHRYAARGGKRIRCVSKETSQLLQSYDWPGNIRELQNVIERAVIVCDSDALSIDARWLSGRPLGTAPVASFSTGTLTTNEKDAIEAALTGSKGRVAGPFGAAARLDVPASTLESKIKALKIDKRRFKSSY
jgi:PAS domain S-box-containing protein